VQFHLEQAKARTQQRLREGRPKPIDIIVRNLYFPDDVDADGADPYEIAKSLTLPELRGLADDVQDYQVRLMFSHHAPESLGPGGIALEAKLASHACTSTACMFATQEHDKER
jgi:Conserved mid region of cactin